MRYILFMGFCLMLPLRMKAQIGFGIEGGGGTLIKNTRKISGNHDKDFHTHSMISASLFIQSQRDRVVNFGAGIAYVHRSFSWTNYYIYGTGYINSYFYIAPYFDLSYDKHRYFHIQVLAPVGLFAGGQDVETRAIYDSHGSIVRDSVITSTENISRINARIGASIYAQIPLGKMWSALAKVEYTICANQLSTYNGFQVNPSDLLFKFGLSYTIR